MATDKKTGFFTLRRLFSLVLLCIALLALFLALKKPQPPADAQSPALLAANAESFQKKVNEMAELQAQGQGVAEIRLTGDEVAAALAQSNAGSTTEGGQASAPATADATTLHDPVVSFEGDIVRGQFATEVSGKTVYITVAGHLGAKDGYATFEPTEFKLGDLTIPVSLINPALQKKMSEQRDRMKLPDFVSDVRVENGELVVKQK